MIIILSILAAVNMMFAYISYKYGDYKSAMLNSFAFGLLLSAIAFDLLINSL